MSWKVVRFEMILKIVNNDYYDLNECHNNNERNVKCFFSNFEWVQMTANLYEFDSNNVLQNWLNFCANSEVN